MALVEDMLKGNLVVALAVGGTALVLPKVLPHLSPPGSRLLKNGLSLFLECELEAEGGIIDKLEDHALKGVLASLSSPDPPQDRQGAARAAVERFKHVAHTRARRYGRSQHDPGLARYDRHITALRHALHRSGRVTLGAKAAVLDELSATLAPTRARSLEENRRGNTGRRYEGGEPGRTCDRSRRGPPRPGPRTRRVAMAAACREGCERATGITLYRRTMGADHRGRGRSRD